MTAHRCRCVPLIIAALCAASGYAGAAVTDEAHHASPLDDAQAVLRVNDLRWLEAQVTQFAGTAGLPGLALRDHVARSLFLVRSLDAIDRTRPALVAWRAGAGPLLAIIPIADRKAFMDGYGSVPGRGAPLIRIGERNGTTVYSQNTDQGLCEYRLLVQGDTAYLARTVDECRALAAVPLRVGANDAPVAFQASGTFFAGSSPDTAFLTDAGAAFTGVAAAVRSALVPVSTLCDQVATFGLTLTGADGDVRVQCRVAARSDAPLAVWMSNQKNQSSRLLAAVRGRTSVAWCYGGIAWQGQLARFGVDLGRGLAKRLGPERWTSAVEEAWTNQWTILDGQGAFAAAVDAEIVDGAPSVVAKSVLELPRAGDYLASDEVLAPELSPASEASVKREKTEHGAATGDILTTTVGATRIEQVRLASQKHLVSIYGYAAAAMPTAISVSDALQQQDAPEGASAVLCFGCDCTALIELAERMAHQDLDALPATRIELAIGVDPGGELTVDCALPLQRIATLLRDSALFQRASGPGANGNASGNK